MPTVSSHTVSVARGLDRYAKCKPCEDFKLDPAALEPGPDEPPAQSYDCQAHQDKWEAGAEDKGCPATTALNLG